MKLLVVLGIIVVVLSIAIIKGYLEHENARSIAAVAIPVLIAGMGFYAKELVERRNLASHYVDLAIRVLGDDSGRMDLMRGWAVDLLEEYSPKPLPQTALAALRTGAMSFGPPTVAPLEITMIPGQIDSAGVHQSQGVGPIATLQAPEMLQVMITNRREFSLSSMKLRIALTPDEVAQFGEIRSGYPTTGTTYNDGSHLSWLIGALGPGETAEIHIDVNSEAEGLAEVSVYVDSNEYPSSFVSTRVFFP